MKLTLVARKIIVCSSEHASTMAADLRNGPLHVFGVHENCKDYYCNVSKTLKDGTEKKEEDLVERLKTTAPEVWALIYAANEKIALKAGRLSNETTNVAENFMSVINKFNCGKRISLGKGGSYQRRVHVAGKYKQIEIVRTSQNFFHYHGYRISSFSCLYLTQFIWSRRNMYFLQYNI